MAVLSKQTCSLSLGAAPAGVHPCRVQEVDEVGNLLSVFGGPGLLQAPAGVAVLADGGQAARVLVADAARGEVLIFQRTTG